MKIIFIIILYSISLQILADDNYRLKNDIMGLSDRIYRHVDYTNATRDELVSAKDLLESTLGIITGSGPNTFNSCVNYILSKGHLPYVAKSTCDQLTHSEYQCVRIVIEKNYSPQEARLTCYDVRRHKRVVKSKATYRKVP